MHTGYYRDPLPWLQRRGLSGPPLLRIRDPALRNAQEGEMGQIGSVKKGGAFQEHIWQRVIAMSFPFFLFPIFPFLYVFCSTWVLGRKQVFSDEYPWAIIPARSVRAGPGIPG